MGFSVTQSSISSMLTANLDSQQSSLSVLEQQLSSGVNYSQPSQDPAAVVQALGISSQVNRFNQYVSNANDGLIVAKMADSTLNSAVSALQQARTVYVAAGGAGITPASAAGLVQSLQSAYQSLLGLANTTYMGQGIFAGTSGSATAYDSAGNYLGSQSSPTRTVAPAFQTPVAVTAPFGQSGAANNVFGALQTAISDLKAGNYSKVYNSDLATFDNAMQGVLSAAASQGQMVQQLQYMQNQATQTVQDLQAQYGSIQNVNVAKVASDYAQAMNNYQIAMQVAVSAVQPTLAKYI